MNKKQFLEDWKPRLSPAQSIETTLSMIHFMYPAQTATSLVPFRRDSPGLTSVDDHYV